MAARTRAEELEKDNSDMAARLAKKEQELDLRMQEKVQILFVLIKYSHIRLYVCHKV